MSPVHYFSRGPTILNGPGSHKRGFTFSLRHTTLGENLLVEWSARRRDLYLTTHNTHKGLTSLPQAEFEPVLSSSERPQFHALDRATAGISESSPYRRIINLKWFWPCIVVIMWKQPANRTHNLQLHTIPTIWKPKHQIPQAATIYIILSSSWWWA